MDNRVIAQDSTGLKSKKWTALADKTSTTKGYKEEHDLVVVDGANEPHNGNEQQEDTHSDHPADDVDAGHQAEALAPCCHSDEQQPHQLEDNSNRGSELTFLPPGCPSTVPNATDHWCPEFYFNQCPKFYFQLSQTEEPSPQSCSFFVQ